MKEERCPFCHAEAVSVHPDFSVFACGTMGKVGMWIQGDACVESELVALRAAKARLEAELAKARMRAAGLVCCLRAYDGSAIPASDARDAFAFLAQFAGKEVIDAAWYGAGRRAGREEAKP